MDFGQPWYLTLYRLLNGVGHMWFLPMLFWCFMGIYFVERLHLCPLIAFPLFFFIALLPLGALPLRIGNASYYFLFFYLGYFLQYQNVDLHKISNKRFLITSSLLFVVLFPTLTVFCGNIGTHSLLSFFLCRLCKIVYALIGIIMVLSVIKNILKERSAIPSWIVDFGNLCMGVYLFQQFILKAIYNYTSLPTLCGPYLLPWVSFVFTLLVSTLAAYYVRKTHVGRLLIG